MNLGKTKLYCVVADASARNAGYRIRTQPFLKKIESHFLDVKVIQYDQILEHLDSIDSSDRNVILFSKPFSQESYLVAKYFSSSNVIVADIFDNYLSEHTFSDRKPWVNFLNVLPLLDLCTVSTPRIVESIQSLVPELPSLVIDDPLPEFDLIELPLDQSVMKKWDRSSDLRLLWFGIASNPYYHAGLSDLLSWSTVIQNIVKEHKSLTLSICSNAMGEKSNQLLVYTLTKLRMDNPTVNFEVIEWSEQECEVAIRQAHVVLLPTNITSFSVSKTHNRCTEAIRNGALVLASPFGPYGDMKEAVFFKVSDLLGFLQSATPEKVLGTLHNSIECFYQRASKYEKHHHFIETLSEMNVSDMKPSNSAVPAQLLITGDGSAHVCKLARQLGYLLVGCLGTDAIFSYDFMIDDQLTFETFRADGRSRIFIFLSDQSMHPILQATNRFIGKPNRDGSLSYDLRGRPEITIHWERKLLILDSVENLDDLFILYASKSDAVAFSNRLYALLFAYAAEGLKELFSGCVEFQLNAISEVYHRVFRENIQPDRAELERKLLASHQPTFLNTLGTA